MTDYSTLKGVLPDTYIRELIREGCIDRACASMVGSSSLDTTVSTEIYMVSALPMPRQGESIRNLLKSIPRSRHNIANPLQRGLTYVVRLNERFKLPKNVYAYGNPKSTTGRSGMHVRLLADGVPAYDTIPPGYEGDVWLEVKPFAFMTLLYDGLPLNQIRFFSSDTRIRDKEALLAMEKSAGSILFKPDGSPIPLSDVADYDGSVSLAIDLASDIVGYEAIATHAVLDMAAKGLDRTVFWRAIPLPTDGRLFLERDHFYILSSIEGVRVPITHACEMRAMDDRVGNFRSHFAGYIDDGWGGSNGSTLTLEVQPFAPMYLRVDQPVARIVYEAMAAPAEKPYTEKSSNYVDQVGPKLGKQFK